MKNFYPISLFLLLTLALNCNLLSAQVITKNCSTQVNSGSITVQLSTSELDRVVIVASCRSNIKQTVKVKNSAGKIIYNDSKPAGSKGAYVNMKRVKVPVADLGNGTFTVILNKNTNRNNPQPPKSSVCKTVMSVNQSGAPNPISETATIMKNDERNTAKQHYDTVVQIIAMHRGGS